MTIDELLAAAGLTANDEIPIWDAEATGEPTKKITAQNLAAAVVALANLVTGVKGNAEANYRHGDVNITPANIGAVNKAGDTMTGNLTITGETYPALALMNNSNDDQVQVVGDLTQNRLEIVQKHKNNNYTDYFFFPDTSNSPASDNIYTMLTTKSPVLVTQGGTGATTPAGARTSLGALGSLATNVSFSGSATNFYQNLGAQISTMTDHEARIFVVVADATDGLFYQWHIYSGTIVRYANATCGGILTDQLGISIAIGCNSGTWYANSL